ncbi:MAG: hypothetical protein HC783_02430 [Rhodobacteraceae bacterium]|nr:hypothetical protein [Paracoccaceae bacterium]
MAAFRHHDVTFLTPARVLTDFARDLADTLPAPLGHPVEVAVGLHRPADLARERATLPPGPAPALRLGLQTEHILDADGMPLWQSWHIGTVQAEVAAYDAVLDLSPANHEVYDALSPDLRARVRLGPHIFPSQPPPFAPVPGGPMLFFGGVNPRRQRRFAKLQGRGLPVTVLPHATFGADLRQELSKAAAVLNIHFAPARYTEAPRILKAVLAGKPLISEDLALPFLEGTHYLSLAEAKASDATLQTSYEALASLCAQYSFPGFLRAVLHDKGLSAP